MAVSHVRKIYYHDKLVAALEGLVRAFDNKIYVGNKRKAIKQTKELLKRMEQE